MRGPVGLDSARCRQMLDAAARDLGVDPSGMRAMLEVESGNTGVRVKRKLGAALPSLIFLAAGVCFTVKMFPDALGTAGCLLFIAGTVMNLAREIA